MHGKRLNGDRHGVAGAVATMFVLLIVLAFINLYITGYVPSYENGQEYSHMQQLYSEYSSLQMKNYNLESGKWPYPVTTTLTLGTPGSAPFASPTSGSMSFSTTSFSALLSYQLALPQSVPAYQHVFYESYSGTSTSSAISINATFLADTNNSYYALNTGPIADSGGSAYAPVYFVPQNSSVRYVVNSSYVLNDDFDISVGSLGGAVLNNFTLTVILNGNNNGMDFTGFGNNVAIWYLSYGANNRLSDASNPCGFSFIGNGDSAYVQNYGQGDTAPFGWPQFKTVTEYDPVTGSVSTRVNNQFYTPQTVAYEGGAIILAQSGGAIVQSGPQLSGANSSSTGATVSMNLVSLLGQNGSASGSGPVSVTDTYFSNRNVTVGQFVGLNMIDELTLTIHSAYAAAWAAYLSQALASLQNVTSDPQVALVGSGCTDPPVTPVTWGAYALTVSGGTLVLSIYNIANLLLDVGYLQASVP